MPAPGVVVTTAVRSGPTGTPRAASGQYFVIGLAERGLTSKPQKVNSLADYRRLYGERVTYGALYDDLAAFFEAGGQQAYVLRAVGSAATAGTLNLVDSSAATPPPTIRVNAASEGQWSSRLTVQVEAGTNPNTRKITVRLDGTVVESYNNLATVAQAVSRFADSPYVRLTDLGSTSATPLPAIVSATAVTAGTDDRATVNAAVLTAKLPLFVIGLGDGAIAAPGFGQAMHTALLAHAAANRRVAILAAARGTSVQDLAVLGLALNIPGAQYGGLFGPHLQVSDGSGGLRVISPEGYVAASRARAHDTVGPWTPAAGELSISPYVAGLDQEFTRADHEVLDAARVSPIRIVASRIRLYGWRSLSGDEDNFGSLTVQDTLNWLVTSCEARLESFVHRVIDGRGQLFAEMAGVLVGVLEPIRAAGGIFERTDQISREVIDPGYSVDVGPNVNTLATMAGNEARAVVAVRLSPNAALVNLTIVKVGLAAAV